jgi:hypothetical protein
LAQPPQAVRFGREEVWRRIAVRFGKDAPTVGEIQAIRLGDIASTEPARRPNVGVKVTCDGIDEGLHPSSVAWDARSS